MRMPRIPLTAQVIITFNGSDFHLKEGRAYRHILEMLLRKHPAKRLAVLTPDSTMPGLNQKSVSADDCVHMLQAAVDEVLEPGPEAKRAHKSEMRFGRHGGVDGIPSALVVRTRDTIRAYFFNHKSEPVEQKADMPHKLWKRLACA